MENFVDQEITDGLISDLLVIIKQFPIDILPYAAISQFVYNNHLEDFTYFFEQLTDGVYDVADSNDPNFKKYLKLLEHMELADQQKVALFNKQKEEIEKLKRFNSTYEASANELKQVTKKIDELQETSKNMTTNFISILGIFAGILMGAFGALQGFTSLFANADKLSLGKLLIISSISASSVILILFLLLNGVAKLTNKSLSSSTRSDDNIFNRHPTLIIIYGILILISLVGSALELSNTVINYAPEGYWWIVPGVWFIYFITVLKTKKFFILK
ncbi:hypothetical protein [Niallia taxi]|nr:hypothetical protein [Niallia taxi]